METKMVHRFTMEISELRALGFAESLPLEPLHQARGIVARLESGRTGVAVEIWASEDMPTYTVVPLLAEGANAHLLATEIWSDIVRDIRRRAPLSDDE